MVKEGRGRRYAGPAVEGFANAELAAMVAGLDELLARHRDLIEDLPGEALRLVPEGLGNSLAYLTRHMAWAEGQWLSALAGRTFDPALDAALHSDEQDDSAAALLGLCEQVRETVTRPILALLTDPMAVTVSGERRLTPRGVGQHLLWHWTYHGGQCGILRRLSGHPYRWTFDERAFGA